MRSGQTCPAVTDSGVPLWAVQAGSAPRTPPTPPAVPATPPAVVGGHGSADDADACLETPAPVAKPVLGARLAVDVLPGVDVRDSSAPPAASPTSPAQAAAALAGPVPPHAPWAVGVPLRDLPVPSAPVQALLPLPVQDVLPGRDLVTAAPVDPTPAAGWPSTPTVLPSPSEPVREADDRPVGEAAAAVAPPAVEAAVPYAAVPYAAVPYAAVPYAAVPYAAVPHAVEPTTPPAAASDPAVAEPVTVAPPVAPEGTRSGHPAPVDDLATSLALLVATGGGQEAPAGVPAAGPGASPAVAEAVVPPQVRRRVELGFRDGSSTALDPDSEQAVALAELSSLLTGRE